VFVVCELGRRFSKSTLRNRDQLIFAMEFFGTLQLCTMAFENGVVLKNYGFTGFFLAIAASVVLHSLTLVEAYATPCVLFEESTRHRRLSNSLLIRLAAQFAAGVLAFRLAKLVWGLGFMPDHSSLASRYACSSDLHVPLLAGLLYEMAATFVCRLAFLKAHEPERNWSIVADALVIPSIVLIGLTTTGMYFNPILAFSITYGCDGVKPVEHALVYWLGPFIGWTLATEVHARTRSLF